MAEATKAEVLVSRFEDALGFLYSKDPSLRTMSDEFCRQEGRTREELITQWLRQHLVGEQLPSGGPFATLGVPTRAGVARPEAWELWKLFAADLERYRPPTTARLYATASLKLLATTSMHPLDWTPQRLRSYFDDLTPANAALQRKALTAWLGWLVERGYREDNPLDDTPRPARKRGRRIKRALLEPEYLSLIAELNRAPRVDREDFKDARRRIVLMVKAQRYTGVRPGEICTMDRRDVYLRPDPEPRLQFVAGKTDDERFIPLNDRAHEVFEELCQDRVGRLSNVRTQTYWEVVHEAAARAGLPREKQRPYALRHTFCTALMDAGVPDDEVAKLMGWADTRPLNGYTGRTYKDLRAAVDLLI